jgi:hypothetical protein
MKIKIKSWLFYLTILVQLQLDLLLLGIGLQSLLCTILFLLVFTKKRNIATTSFAILAFSIEKFITLHKLGLDILLILFIFFLSKIFKKNIVFKSFVYYLLLIIYLLLHAYLTNVYFFKIPFEWQTTFLQIIINVLWASVIKYLYTTKDQLSI